MLICISVGKEFSSFIELNISYGIVYSCKYEPLIPCLFVAYSKSLFKTVTIIDYRAIQNMTESFDNIQTHLYDLLPAHG